MGLKSGHEIYTATFTDNNELSESLRNLKFELEDYIWELKNWCYAIN